MPSQLLGILAGTLLLIIGFYNVAINIQEGSFFALLWLIAVVFGVYFIELGTSEVKKRRE